MGLSRITCIELVSNYPDNIRCHAFEENGKYGYIVYLMRGGAIHKSLFDCGAIHETEEAANNSFLDTYGKIKHLISL